MRIGIIGASGRMGQWFLRLFASKGHQVGVYSRRGKTGVETAGVLEFKTVEECAKFSEVILVSVPIAQTAKVVSEVAMSCSSTQTIIEIASLKRELVPKLKEVAATGVNVLSIHPLFGPGADISAKQPYALIPISSDESDELRRFSKILPDSRITTVNEESHDKSMGYVLSLTHFVNLAFLSSLTARNELLELAGTTFKLQVSLAQAILHDEPELLAALETENPYFQNILSDFLKNSRNIESMVKRKDSRALAGLFASTREKIRESESFLSSYTSMYEILNRTE